MSEISLPDELHLLEKNYTAVAMTVMASLGERNVPVASLYQCVCSLPQYLLQPKYKKLIQKKASLLEEARTVGEFFTILSPYCDFMNPDLVKEIADRFADEATSLLVHTYIKTLRDFRRKTAIGSIAGCWVGVTPPGYVEVLLEMGSKWNRRNLEYLEIFRSYPPRLKWFFKRSMKGEGLGVVFSVPKGAWLYQEELDNMIKFDVLRVTEGGRCLVQLDKDRETLNQCHLWPVHQSSSVHDIHRASYFVELNRSASDNQLDRPGIPLGFSLPQEVLFGFHRQAGSNVFLSRNSLHAIKRDKMQGSSLVYSAVPFKGVVEFEVRMVDYYQGIRGSIRLGIMRRPACHGNAELSMPRQLEHRDNSCMWFRSSFKQRTEFQNNLGSHLHLLRFYGRSDLGELQQGDRVGLQLTAQGHLSFFMNGLNQGVAAEGVYQEDWDMFCFVEMTEGCEAIEVTRATMLEVS